MRKGNHRIIGAYLRAKREEKGLSQLEVSRQLGYSSSQFVSNFERGLCGPSWKALRELIEIYDMSEREIVEFLMKMQKDMICENLFGKKGYR